jgi:hypothetical protein
VIEAGRAIAAPRITLAWSQHAGQDCLRVLGLRPEELEAVLRRDAQSTVLPYSVVPASVLRTVTDLQTLQPVAGRFEGDQDALCFVPRWPFVPGLEYALVERSPAGALRAVAALHRPSRGGSPTTEVLAMYPSAPAVPVNLLKLYVYFSAPMSEGNAARAVQVRRADTNEALEDVFLPGDLELWDRDRRRLTLLLDPGRIKRGLVPHRQMGYPLVEGVPITLTIDVAFRDAAGRPLRRGATRRFDVTAPIRTRIDPRAWQLQAPGADSREPLSVAFDRPLDRALLEHAFTVNSPDGGPVRGSSEVGPMEQAWRFAPEAEWDAGEYTLTVDQRLEDLAGNSLARVFDRDLTRSEDIPTETHPVRINFAV